MIEIPIFGAVALGAGTVLERSILKIKKIGIKLYQTASFLAIILACAPLLYFFWRMDSGALTLKSILIFAGVIISAIIANLFVFYSLKWEKVTNLEPARIMEPLFTVLLAVILSFFIEGVYERNIRIIIPAVISALAIMFPHIKKHHLHINRYIIAAIFGSFFFALELVLSKLILEFYSPIAFYFIRCSAIFLISLIAFRPNFKNLNRQNSLIILVTGAVWVVYRVAVYFGYINYGVVFTTLMIMLGPIMVYALARIFLKEKLNWKNIISALVVIVCVLYAILG